MVDDLCTYIRNNTSQISGMFYLISNVSPGIYFGYFGKYYQNICLHMMDMSQRLFAIQVNADAHSYIYKNQINNIGVQTSNTCYRGINTSEFIPNYDGTPFRIRFEINTNNSTAMCALVYTRYAILALSIGASARKVISAKINTVISYDLESTEEYLKYTIEIDDDESYVDIIMKSWDNAMVMHRTALDNAFLIYRTTLNPS